MARPSLQQADSRQEVKRDDAAPHTQGRAGKTNLLRLRSWRWPNRDTLYATIALCVAFYFAAQIGLALHFPSSLVYFAWPPSVLVFVALILSPRQNWWVYFLALLPIHVLTELGTVSAPLGLIALFYVPVWTQALAGALCVERFIGRPVRLGTLRALIIFLLSAAVIAALTEAVTLASILALTERDIDFWQDFAQTVFAAALTMVVLGPALVTAWATCQGFLSPGTSGNSAPRAGNTSFAALRGRARAWLRAVPLGRSVEAIFLALAILGIGLVAFGGYVALPATLPALLYTLLPFLLWAAVRFGLGGTSAALCGLTLISVEYAVHGRGPFSKLSATENLFSMQLFFIAISIPVLALAVLVQERQTAQRSLRQSETRYRDLVESQTEMICRYLPDSTLTYVNEAYCRAYGSSREKLIGVRFFDQMDQAARDHHVEYISTLLSQAQPAVDEHENTLADGSVRWHHWEDHAIRDANGNVVEIQSVGRDITDRKQTQEALRASEERYRAVVNNFPQGVVLLFGQDMRHILADGQGLPGLGVSQDAIVGKTVWEAFPPELSAALAPRYQAALTGAHAAIDLVHAGHTYQTQVLPIQYAGDTAGMTIMQDVTEERRAEMLAELDRAKTAFFSNVSHEFRTPLTLLLGPAADALADRNAPLPPQQRQRLELIQRGGLRLYKLVNTLLDFSRLEAGRVQANYEPTNVARLTAELASTFRSAVERAGLRLIVESVELTSLRQPVFLDREMWEKIVLNLLSNAFKFTFEGSITVSVGVAASEPEAGQGSEWVELQVRDTGTGIPTEELPHIFERFHRVQSAQARTQEGTGIGLALVQELVRLHGGVIRVSSTPGVGSAFTVAIPTGDTHLPADRILRGERARSTPIYTSHTLDTSAFADEALHWLPEPQPAQHPSEPTQTRQRGASVLVAEDNADMRAYLKRLLSERWEVEAVSDGLAALSAAQARPPDLVLADVMMPGLDGFALVSALRSHPQTHDVPIMLVSARAGEEAIVEGLQTGADDYLVKPFSARELYARVQTHLELGHARREAATRAAQMEAIFEAITDGVLVHDLDERRMYSNRAYHDLLRRHLEMQGHRIDPDTVLTYPGERQRYIAVSDEHGYAIPSEMWPTERALRGETLTGEYAVDEFSHGSDGAELQLNVSAAPVRSPNGKITGAVAVFRDVTARRRLERQVAEQASQLETIFDAMTEGITVLDIQGRVTRTNPAARALTELATGDGLAPEAFDPTVSGRARALELRDAAGQLIPGEQSPAARLLRGEVLTADNALIVRLGPRDSRARTVSLTGGPLRDATGQIVGAVEIARDVTELQRTQAALAEHERLFRTLVENSPDIITRFDRDLRHLYVSPASEAVTGIPATARLGKTYAELGLPESVYGPWELPLRRTFVTGQPQVFETVYHGDGRPSRISQVRYIPEFAPDGSVESVLGITADITELKRTEEALRQSEERFSKAFHASPIAIAIISRARGRILDANRAMCQLTGYGAADLLGATVCQLRVIAPGAPHTLRDLWGRHGNFSEAPLRLRRRSGEIRSCLSSTALIQVGGEECMLVTTRDVTEHERTEEALRRQERLYRTLVENSPNIIARFDRDLRYLYINPAISELGPIPPEHYLGKTNQELGWPESSFREAHQAIKEVFQTGQSLMLVEDDAAYMDVQNARYFRAQILPEFGGDGSVESVLTVTNEITDLKRAEEALRAATAGAEAAQHAEERRRHEAERRERIAESLRDVLTILNSDRQVTTMLDFITRQAGRLLSSDAAAIYTTRTDDAQTHKSASGIKPSADATGSLALQAAFGLRAARRFAPSKRRLAVGDTAIRRAMVARRPVAVLAQPGAADERASAGDTERGMPRTEPEGNYGPSGLEYVVRCEEPLPAPYRALLAIPIVAQGHVYGGLLLLYEEPRGFSVDEIALAMAYGDQIALAVANARLQDQIERSARETERNRLARELHDTVTQEIFTASMVAESIPRVWEHHRVEAEENLRQLHQLTRGALAALRALLLELRPAVLEQKSLPDLLRQLGEAMATRSGVPIALSVADECPPLPVGVKIAFYRIAQEALTNVAKYAHASAISVRLRCLPSGEGNQLVIEDDGQGFNASGVQAGHFGLGMMRERARAVGATLRITSRLGRGTRVSVRWTSGEHEVTHEQMYASVGRAEE